MCLVLACGLTAGPAKARLNLPQIRQTIRLTEGTEAAAREYFSHPSSANELSGDLQDLLVKSLPDNLGGACGALMETWGQEAVGTGYWRVRVLSQQGQQVWLAFRCGSHLHDLADYYDERLALLRPDAGTLELVPLARDADNDSDLYRLEFDQLFAFGGGTAAAFQVLNDSKNPCCDGGASVTEEKMIAYADSPQGISQILSVVTLHDLYNHDDECGDSETIYKAEVKLERDAHNQVTAATATFSEEVNAIVEKGATSEPQRISQRTGALHYRWNPASFRFDEVK